MSVNHVAATKHEIKTRLQNNRNLPVSVLMPAYNAEKYVEDAIESVLKQSFKDFELIIIDDCSSDNTWEIIDRQAKSDVRISAYRNEKNLGISATRNVLIHKSVGKYIVWQDSDDISLPDRLMHQVEFMENHPEVGICGGFLQYFDDTGLKGIRKYRPNDAELRNRIFRYSPVAQPAAIIRRECFEITGYFPQASPVAEDLAMSFQIGTKYKFANLQEIVIKYREVHSGATFSKLRIIELYSLFLREVYGHNIAYKVTFTDKLYNALHILSIYFLPSHLKIRLFNLFRNT